MVNGQKEATDWWHGRAGLMQEAIFRRAAKPEQHVVEVRPLKTVCATPC